MVVDEPETVRPVRVLMKDGKWLVPPESRPSNWQELEIPAPYSAEANRKVAHGIHRWRRPSRSARAAVDSSPGRAI
jgi:hypothetical protein